MTTEAIKNGLLDLENELSCSICTEVLYQPLTLLDCLHTFCGSCLKLWFAWQASAGTDRRANPYTCPSCRASVRGTRPDAKITTLLEMYLHANPSKGKTAEERKEIEGKYKPNDNVIPHVDGQAEEEWEDEDRRMVEEVREMSLRESSSRGAREYERGTRHMSRDRRHNGRSGSAGDRTPRSSDSRSQARQIEHQSSLRSLISSSDVDSTDMEEEILRQIMEDGLLDGINLEDLDTTHLDELSERIAEAYRRRHGPRARSPDQRRQDPSQSQSNLSAPTQQGTRRHTRSTSAADSTATSSHPPISRPHLLEAYPTGQGQGHRRRTSSEHRRQTSPSAGTSVVRQEASRSATDLSNRRSQTSPVTTPSSRNETASSTDLSTRRRRASPSTGVSDVRRDATRSATDLSVRPGSSDSRRRRTSELQAPRRSTDSRPPRLDDGQRSSSGPTLSAETRSRRGSSRSHAPAPLLSPTTAASPTHLDSPASQIQRTPRDRQLDSPRLAPTSVRESSDGMRPSSSSSTVTRARPTLYAVPSITCDGCGKTNIQYDLYDNCAVCKDGNWNLCHLCYRSGKGCLHFYGFGNAALRRFQQTASAGQDLPHALVGKQYQRPKPETVQPSSTGEAAAMTADDPSKQLLSGAFCYICESYANDCFWKCDFCNDGEWGYCNRCVNTGHCCTHPLLPLAHIASSKAQASQQDHSAHSSAVFPVNTSPAIRLSFPPSDLRSPGQFCPLIVSTNCSICTYPIQPSQSRFHCYQCNDGDYDICTNCYAKLCNTGRITRENGDKGWRRCLRGHRMVLLFFEDTPGGQLRIVVQDLVGGHFLKDEDGAAAARDDAGKFPPDGGVGVRLLARYTWLPAEGVKDELAFPRGAEIREALETASSEWYSGCYAGAKGLFPSNHVMVLGVVSM